MSVVNISNLLVQLNQKINSTSDDKEILILVKALEKLKTGIVFTVPTFANLPDASENVGKLYFVENDGILYFSVVSTYNNSEYWVPVTNGLQINTLFSWGAGSFGKLGHGTISDRSSPGTIVAAGINWCNVSGGFLQTAAIKTDGTLWTWGDNCDGVLGNNASGTAGGAARSCPGTVAGGGINWCQVSTGNCHTLAIKTDGTLWTWGNNACGKLGDGTTASRSSPGTVAGAGTTWCWVVAAVNHTSAIKTDGTIWTWGRNNYGALGDGTTLNRSSPGTIWGSSTTWCQVSIKECQSAAVKTDGTLWTWGNNNQGRLGFGQDGVASARCSPGTVAGSGTTWQQVSIGEAFMTATKTDGTLWTWGWNTQGRLGDGTTVSRCSPGTVAGGGTNWCQTSSGSNFSAAIKTDGTLWTWGDNTQGKLGDSNVVSRSSPGTVAGGGTNWCQVSAASLHLAAIQRETL